MSLQKKLPDNRKHYNFKVLLLTFWIIGILFPFPYLRHLSSTYHSFYYLIFGTTLAHVVIRIFLYAGLAYLFGSILHDRFRIPHKRVFILALLVVFGVAILQELIQLVFEGSLTSDNYFDISVDLSGGLVGAFLLWFKRRGSKANSKHPEIDE